MSLQAAQVVGRERSAGPRLRCFLSIVAQWTLIASLIRTTVSRMKCFERARLQSCRKRTKTRGVQPPSWVCNEIGLFEDSDGLHPRVFCIRPRSDLLHQRSETPAVYEERSQADAGPDLPRGACAYESIRCASGSIYGNVLRSDRRTNRFRQFGSRFSHNCSNKASDLREGIVRRTSSFEW